MKLALNDTPRRANDIDVLCHAGEEGWELVAVLPTGVAYLKRPLEIDFGKNAVENAEEDSAPPKQPIVVAAREEVNAAGHEVKPKYRDRGTGDTWSGRGRMAGWLKRKQDAGEDIEEYRA